VPNNLNEIRDLRLTTNNLYQLLNINHIFKKFRPDSLSGNKPVFIVFLFFLCAFSSLKAQVNLVPNGSFEEYVSCPIGIADFSVANWNVPTFGTSDYFNVCSIGDAAVPSNFAGFQYPVNGNGYLGFVAGGFVPSQFNSREYLQVELLESLIPNEVYEISFYLSLAEISRFSCNKLEITLSNSVTNEFISSYLTPNSYVLDVLTDHVNDTIEWKLCSLLFKAQGGEKFLILGVFDDDQNADFSLFNELNEAFSYYFIDDFRLEKFDNSIIPNIFTPNNDGVNDVWSFNFVNDFELLILNRWGQPVFKQFINDKKVSWSGQTTEGITCNDGVYYFFLSKGNIKKTGFIQLIR